MKKWSLLLVCGFLAVLFGLAVPAAAENEWAWRLDDEGFAYVTAYSGTEKNVTLPAALDGCPVVGVDSGAFPACVASVRSPALVTAWQENAVAPGTIIVAAHGTAALAFAEQQGLPAESLSQLDFSQGVVDLQGDERTWTRQGGVFVFPAAYARVIQPGTLFFAPPESSGEMGTVYETRGAKVSGNTVTITARQASADAAYESFSVRMENLAPDYAHMQVLSDRVVDVSYQNNVNNTTTMTVEDGGVTLRSRSAPISAKTADFKLEIPVGHASKATVQIELEMTLAEFSVSFKNHFGKIDNAAFLVNASTRVQVIGSTWVGTGEEPETHLEAEENLLGHIAAALTDEASSDTIELARIPFMTTGGFTLCVVPRLGVNVEGRLSVSIDSSLDAGFSYDGTSFTNLCALHEPELTTEIAAGFSARLEAAFTASLPMVPDVAELCFTFIQIDGKAEAVLSTNSHTNATNACIDLNLKGHGKVSVGLGLKHAIEKYKTWFKAARNLNPDDLWLSVTLLDVDYFNKSLHYEPGLGVVEKCTKGGVKVIFDANGGEGGTVEYAVPGTRYCLYSGQSQRMFPTVTREGYSFVEWCDQNGEYIWQFNVGSEEIRVYAKWEQNEAQQITTDYYIENPDYSTICNYFSSFYVGGNIGHELENVNYYGEVTIDREFKDVYVVEANLPNPGEYYKNKISNATEHCMGFQDGSIGYWYTVPNGEGEFMIMGDWPRTNYRFWGAAGHNMSNLTSITYSSLFIGTAGNYCCPNLESVTFSPGMVIIGRYHDCYALKSISIPDSVEKLNYRAFKNCISLKTAKLPNGIKKIPAGLFENCVSLTSIVIPPSVEEIEEGAFKNCTSLTSITIPSSVKIIGGDAFKNCTSLKNITLPSGMTFLGQTAFEGCSSLEEITLPQHLDAFPSFKGCVSLKAIHFPASSLIESVSIPYGDELRDCAALESLTLHAKNVVMYVDSLPSCKTISITADEGMSIVLNGNCGAETVSLSSGEGISFYLEGTSRGHISLPNLRELSVSAKRIGTDLQIDTGADMLTVSTDISEPCDYSLKLVNSDNLLTYSVLSNGAPPSIWISYCPGLESVHITRANHLTQIRDCPAMKELTVDAMTGVLGNTYGDSALWCNLPSLNCFRVPEGCTKICNLFISTLIDHTIRLIVPASVPEVELGNYLQYSSPPIIETPLDSPAAQQCPDFVEGPYKLEFRSEFGIEHAPYTGLAANAFRKLPGASELYSAINGLEFSNWDIVWYEDEACTQPVTLETINWQKGYRMPGHDTVLYVKWSINNPYEQETYYQEYDTPSGKENGRIVRKFGESKAVFSISSYTGGIAADAIDAVAEVVILPNTLHYVEPGAFRGAASLRRIVVQAGNECFYSTGGALYDWNDTLLAVPAALEANEFHIPQGTKGIADYAFGWEGCPSGLTLVTIPASVTSIGEHAFDGLSGSTVIRAESAAAQQALASIGLRANPAFVLFMANGEAWSYYTVAVGDALPTPASPVQEGNRFLGWSESENGPLVASGYTVPADGAVLYAVWENKAVNINAANFPDAAFREYVLTECDRNGDGVLDQEEIGRVTFIGLSVVDSQISDDDVPPARAEYIRGHYMYKVQSTKGIEYFANLRQINAECMPQLTTMDLSANNQMERVYVRESGLTTLALGSQPSLIQLNCHSNALKTLDVSQCPSLEYVYCHGNGLQSLTLGSHPALKKLLASENQLTSLNVKNCPALKELLCSNNQLTKINLTGNPDLEILSIDNNRLTSLNISQNKKLIELYAQRNELTSLDASGLTSLRHLACTWNSITALNVRGLSGLQALYCGFNQLQELDLTSLTALKELQCMRNQLTALDVRGCGALKVLECYSNRISSLQLNTGIESLTFIWNPLYVLDISGCPHLIACMDPAYYAEEGEYVYYCKEVDTEFGEYLLLFQKGTLFKTGSEDYRVMTLPSQLQVIEEEAFAGAAADVVVIPKTCTAIRARAFADCPNLKTVYVPAGASVDESAFEGCGNVCVVREE